MDQGESVEEGDALMSLLFSVGQYVTLQAVQDELVEGERLFALFDDIYVISTPERVGQVHASLHVRLERHSSIHLNEDKTPVWNAADERVPSMRCVGAVGTRRARIESICGRVRRQSARYPFGPSRVCSFPVHRYQQETPHTAWEDTSSAGSPVGLDLVTPLRQCQSELLAESGASWHRSEFHWTSWQRVETMFGQDSGPEFRAGYHHPRSWVAPLVAWRARITQRDAHKSFSILGQLGWLIVRDQSSASRDDRSYFALLPSLMTPCRAAGELTDVSQSWQTTIPRCGRPRTGGAAPRVATWGNFKSGETSVSVGWCHVWQITSVLFCNLRADHLQVWHLASSQPVCWPESIRTCLRFLCVISVSLSPSLFVCVDMWSSSWPFGHHRVPELGSSDDGDSQWKASSLETAVKREPESLSTWWWGTWSRHNFSVPRRSEHRRDSPWRCSAQQRDDVSWADWSQCLLSSDAIDRGNECPLVRGNVHVCGSLDQGHSSRSVVNSRETCRAVMVVSMGSWMYVSQEEQMTRSPDVTS